MHANTIETHDALTRSAREIAFAWQGTDPMHSVDDVRRAMNAAWSAADDDIDPEDFLPYLVDACRAAGLLA